MPDTYADLTPTAIPRHAPRTAPVQASAAPVQSWDVPLRSTSSVQRQHTPISVLAADPAAVARATARLTYAAGWSTKKAITFDAAI